VKVLITGKSSVVILKEAWLNMNSREDKAKKIALEKAIKEIEKQFGKGAVMLLGDQEARANIDVVPTGSLSLDIALGVGGYPRGRVVEIYGSESSGKTTVALHAIAEVQKMGGTAAFVDAEHALDISYARALGVDVDNLLISQPDYGEQALEIVESLVRSNAVDLVVVDEGSMPDVSLTYHLFKAIPDHASVIMLGDIDQLPSVGPGSVLKDMIASGVVPTKRLTYIYRQAQDSQIVVNAHRINQGLPPVMIRTDTPNDFYIFSDDTPEAIQESVLNLVSSQIPRRFGFDPIEDIQVLVPMHKGPLGTRELNIELQKRLNPPQGPCIKRFGMTYAKGDKILQTVNNYEKEVFNGDIGRIVEIDEEEGLVRVSFDGRLVEYELPELEEISLAYATTIHKSQGSEYPAVVMPLSTQHYVMLERNLLYTGITRGKQLVVLNAQPKALTRAIQTVRAKERKTTLAGRLQDACPFATCEEDDNCGPSF
jgi:exodeoxyribonuclease V alpha subunit